MQKRKPNKTGTKGKHAMTDDVGSWKLESSIMEYMEAKLTVKWLEIMYGKLKFNGF